MSADSDNPIMQSPGGTLWRRAVVKQAAAASEFPKMADESTRPPERERRTIGNMNGPWAILLRLALASYPLVLTWAVWVTTETFDNRAFRNSGERFTSADALKMRAEMTKESTEATTNQNKYLASISDRLVRIETLIQSKP